MLLFGGESIVIKDRHGSAEDLRPAAIAEVERGTDDADSVAALDQQTSIVWTAAAVVMQVIAAIGQCT